MITTRDRTPPEQLIDISILVNEFTPEWPGDTPFSCRWTWDVARGDSVNVSCINGSPHVGTHADAPFHVDPKWPASEALALDAFTGPVTVLDVAADGAVSLSTLGHAETRRHREGREKPSAMEEWSPERLILRTGRSIADGQFPESWPWLDESAAAALVGRGLKLLGVDAPSVDGRDSMTLSVHRILFKGGAAVLENLDLRNAPAGDYHLTAFPVRLAGLDAAPVRAVLRPLAAS